MATHRKQLDEYCSEVRSDWCCRHKVMYGNSKNVIGMSQSAILHPLVAERELTRTLNPAVYIRVLYIEITRSDHVRHKTEKNEIRLDSGYRPFM